jgi:predicted DNA-binding transcriptional regulator AlpA
MGAVMETVSRTSLSPDDPDYLDRLLNEKEAAEFLGYSIRALQNWRLRGGGPRFVKVSSRSVRYRRRDLLAWIEEHLRSSTSESGPPGVQLGSDNTPNIKERQ